MAAKSSIATIAKELGVPSNEILAKVRAAGEYVPSTRAPLLAPVERLVRELFPQVPSPTKPRSAKATRPPAPTSAPEPPRPTAGELYVREMQDPFSPLYRPPGSNPVHRKAYRGNPPQGLTLFLLLNHVTPQNPNPWYPPRRPHGAQFWDDEVVEARHLADIWLPAMFEARLDQHEVVQWIEARVAADHAVELHNAGVTPWDMGFAYENVDGVSLADRLLHDGWTIEQVVTEVSGRRSLGTT